MDEVPLGLGWCHEGNPRPLKLLGVEVRSHGESGSEQANLFQTERLGAISRGAHDAEERDGRPPLQFVEYEMRRVRGDKTKVRACAYQWLNTRSKIIRQVIQPPGVEHCEALVDIKAVDDDVRKPAIRLARAIARQDGPVVIDGGLGPKSADHACGLHSVASGR